ncbi:GFA family protein [Sinimarinibacterium sp. CAU 1509]|uniref:GFA family protein n=1 Tax=Sinimarinibacterium sp. CAU 1509 TaxID=2562283 RepID=UPI0010AB535F|nr:GFA family protein [Sinimarinibacterium sp. CAU 1509]TJY63293.1 GFA family protein [Sinimarinibacterium sp. CAU 1509]
MNTTHHTGSCLCGKVRYDVSGEFQSFFLCHCDHCRKDTGSAQAANLFSTTAQINWLSGFDNVRTFVLPATRHARSFCVNCGSALPTAQRKGPLLVVPAGSLDSSPGMRPTAHIFCASKADWDAGLEDIPEFEKFPSG